MKIKKEIISLILIILVGTYLRLIGVLTNSFAFTYDVGRDMLAVYNIVHFHKIPLIGAILGGASSAGFGVFYGPWWYYFLTPFFIIFSGNPQGIALVMAIIGILSIVLGFIVGEKIGGKFLGLTIAGLISVSPNLISLSSQIWNPNISPLFILLTLISIYKIFTQDRNDKYYFFVGFLLAFIMDLEIIFGILMAVGIIISLAIILKNKLSFRKIFFSFFGALIIFLPRIIFDVRHQFLMTKSILSLVFGNNSPHQSGQFVNILTERLIAMLNLFTSTLSNGNNFIGLIIILFILMSCYLIFKQKNILLKYFTFISYVVILIFIIGTVFLSHDVWPHYLVGLPIFFILLFSISILVLGQKLKTYKPSLIILTVVIILNLNPVSLFENFSKPLWVGDASVYRNQLEAVDYVYKQANGKEFKYVVYTPPLFDYTYQYLFIWYGPNKYHYLPKIQSNLAFFILEPDLQNPKRLTDWLNSRSGDGKIVKTEKLKSGIIIQTRTNK